MIYWRVIRYYNANVIMSAMASEITSHTIVYLSVYSGADQRKHQSSASLAFVRGIPRWPVNSRIKGQQRGKCFHLMTSSCQMTFRPVIKSSDWLITSGVATNETKWSLILWPFPKCSFRFSPLLFMGETLKGNRVRNGAKTDAPEGVASVSCKIDAQRYHLQVSYPIFYQTKRAKFL